MTGSRRTIVALLAVGIALLTLTSSASAHRGRVFGVSFGTRGSGAGQLSLVTTTNGGFATGGSGLAVDETSHDVYVADTGNHRVDEFTANGVFVLAWGWGVRDGAPELQVCTETTGCRAGLSGTAPGEFETPVSIAVDNSPGGEGDVYVADFNEESSSPDRVIQKFTSAGALIESWGIKGQVSQGSDPKYLSFITSIAVAASGDLLVGTNGGVLAFGQSSGTYISQVELSTEWPNGFGVDRAGNWYLNTEPSHVVIKYSSSGTELGGLFELQNAPPENIPGTFASAKGIAVSPAGELFVDEGNAIQVVSSSCQPVEKGSSGGFVGPLCAPLTSFTSPDLVEGAGLTYDAQAESLYIAEVASGKIESIVPEPTGPPLVEPGGESVANVSGDSATLEAVVDPRSEASEEATSYRFEYVSEEHFQREGFTNAGIAPLPYGELTPSFEFDPVTAAIQGLDPGTSYRYRVVAENAISRKEGKASEGERNQAGEEIAHTFTTQALSGLSLLDNRVWELVSPADKHGALIGYDAIHSSQVQAAAEGDSFAYLASAPTEAQPAGNSNQIQVLSTRSNGSWTSRNISPPNEIGSGSNIAISGGSGRTNSYRFFFSSDLSLSVVNPFGPFDPSLSSEASEQTSYLRTNYVNGDPGDPCVSSCYRPLVTGAAGFANVLEGAEFGEGAECRINCHGPEFVGASPDGSHIVLTSREALAEGAPAGALYEWADGQLTLVSVLPDGNPVSAELGGTAEVKEGGGAGLQEVTANTVSADGSRIVWSTGRAATSGQRLYLRDVGAEETVELGGVQARLQAASVEDSRVLFTVNRDLYLFEAPLGGPLSAGHTTQLTSGGGVKETVSGASQDGASVYFVANTVLTSKPGSNGEAAQAGKPNLYLYREGSIVLVAVLSAGDSPDWGGQNSFQMTTARVSPGGRWFEFMSARPLTGYDNRDERSGMPDEEVFLYDSTANGGRGRLVCASCDPTGARPHGVEPPAGGGLLVLGAGGWGSTWFAANVPMWISPAYQPRYLSDSGRLFFDSADELVPSDTNATQDVYEYEPPGVGSCTSASVTFSERSGGCVDLISSGVSKEESAFLDASESGDDVFFMSSAQLSSQDRDSTPDVYDARVDGGLPIAQPPPACEGDACQSPVAPPSDQTPGSLTYQGPGNPVPLLTVSKAIKKKPPKCAKNKKLSHGKCIKKTRAKKARKAIKTRRAGNERRAKS